MKRTVQLVAILMALFTSMSSFAAVNPYDALEVTPNEGEVTSLQHFVITFADLPVVVNQNAIPTLEKGGGATYEGTMRAGDDGKSVLVDFDVCCTASGEYFLNLPENSLTVNNQRLLPITLRFIIEGDMASFYEQITIDPAEGNVESLQNFVISVPEYIGEIDYGSMATLTNNTTGATYQAEMFGVSFRVMAYFPDEITEPGDYTLTLPYGSIIIYTLPEDVHELNFHYTIGGADILYGDVDGDGKIGIADVTALIDLILVGGEAPAEADVDQNGEIGISDVTELIDKILTGN
jgi:hypothetical protein